MHRESGTTGSAINYEVEEAPQSVNELQLIYGGENKACNGSLCWPDGRRMHVCLSADVKLHFRLCLPRRTLIEARLWTFAINIATSAHGKVVRNMNHK